MNKLVDTRNDCAALYSFYELEPFGYILGAYVVEKLPNGSLSLIHQRLLPENIGQFDELVDEQDAELVSILDSITLQNLHKRFAPQLRSVDEFLKKRSKPPHDEPIRRYIQQQVDRAMKRMAGKALYLTDKDGYPARTKLQLDAANGQVVFALTRTEGGTAYSAEVSLDGKPLALHEKPGEILTEQPAWILHGREILGFEENLDAKKLKAFFSKPEVNIPRAAEASYYNKFVKKLLEQHDVQLSGIALNEVKLEPAFQLELLPLNQQHYQLKFVVRYGQETVRPDEANRYIVALDYSPNEVRIDRIERDLKAEEAVYAAYQKLLPSAGLTSDFAAQELYAWLAKTKHALAKLGISLLQTEDAPLLVPGSFSLKLVIEPLAEHESEYYVRPKLMLDDELIEAKHYRGKLRKDSTRIDLGGGRQAYLPEEQHQLLRHLNEAASWNAEAAAYQMHAYQLFLLPKQFCEGWPEKLNSLEATEEFDLPKGLQAELRDYQRAGYNWLRQLDSLGMGGILADDMGLGKTLQTLALLQHEKERGVQEKSLVVVPNSLLFNWVKEAQKFCPGLNLHIYAGTRKSRSTQQLFAYDVLLTTYGMVRQDLAKLSKLAFNYIILDESQYIKNRDAKTTKAVFKLKGRRRLSLTGTPIENSTRDLWTQMHFINPGLLGGEQFFEKTFVEPIEREGSELHAERLRALIKPFVLRRTKEQVAKELPPLIEQVLYCDMEPEQAQLYRSTQEQCMAQLFASSNEPGMEGSDRLQILSVLQQLRQVAIHPAMVGEDTTPSGKMDALWTHLEEILQAGNKVILFSQFVKFLQILRKRLDDQGVVYSYLDGQTPAANRQQAVDAFQEDAERQVFLISLKAGGVGLNLTAAQYVMLLDPWWNPAVEQQAKARAHRIGQQNTVFSLKLITKGSIEEAILELQQRKQALADELIQTEEQFFKSLSLDELKDLIQLAPPEEEPSTTKGGKLPKKQEDKALGGLFA